jgi:signal transduction histidine kinase
VARLRQARSRQYSAVYWLQLIGPILLLPVFVWGAWQGTPAPSSSGQGLLVSLAVTGFAVAVVGRNVTSGRNTGRVHRVFVGLLVASSVLLALVQVEGPGPEAVLLASLCLAVLLPVRVAVPLLVTAFALLIAIAWTTDEGWVNVAVVVALAAFYGLLYLAYRLVEANRHAERLLLELERNQAEQARASVMAERQHLAREMHDLLAHSLSGLILQLEAARMLAAEDPMDPRLTETIDRAHHLGKSGLGEARRAIGMLRDDELPGPESIAGLAAGFGRDRGVPCQLGVAGEARPLRTEARLALYRVAQEALTNITKHAHPERVEVRLDYRADDVRLVVEDFGVPMGPSADGYGLTGMRERAELLGGALHAGPTGTGFRVELVLPGVSA